MLNSVSSLRLFSIINLIPANFKDFSVFKKYFLQSDTVFFTRGILKSKISSMSCHISSPEEKFCTTSLLFPEILFPKYGVGQSNPVFPCGSHPLPCWTSFHQIPAPSLRRFALTHRSSLPGMFLWVSLSRYWFPTSYFFYLGPVRLTSAGISQCSVGFEK